MKDGYDEKLKKMLENGGYRNEKGNDRMVINRG
jgi:hypothetical protein